jgi:hypothetical protein
MITVYDNESMNISLDQINESGTLSPWIRKKYKYEIFESNFNDNDIKNISQYPINVYAYKKLPYINITSPISYIKKTLTFEELLVLFRQGELRIINFSRVPLEEISVPSKFENFLNKYDSNV